MNVIQSGELATATTKFVVASVLIGVLTGCGGMRLHEIPTKDFQKHVFAGGENRKLGLALSGGGIRSGAVSLGVLQTLQESNVLSEFDYVSTVSGGGYPVYGLLYQMVKNKSALPDLLDEKSAFIARAEAKSDFIPNWEYMGAIVSHDPEQAAPPENSPLRIFVRSGQPADSISAFHFPNFRFLFREYVVNAN